MQNNERLIDEQRNYFSSEPKPLKDAFELLCAEYGRTLQLFSNPEFSLEGSKLLARQVIYILLLKQFELVKSSFNSFLGCNYASTAILARSMVETSAFCYYLCKCPQEAEDFVLFSDVIGHPEVDWKRLNISNRKKKNLSEKFSIRRIMREVYSGTDQHEKKINHAWAYQTFSNIAHPNLEPSAIFYTEGAPPSEMFSSVGALRLTFSLSVAISSVNETIVNVFIHDKPLVEAIYADRKKVFSLHDEATQILDSNPATRPLFHRNEKFRIGWKDGKPILTMNA